MPYICTFASSTRHAYVLIWMRCIYVYIISSCHMCDMTHSYDILVYRQQIHVYDIYLWQQMYRDTCAIHTYLISVIPYIYICTYVWHLYVYIYVNIDTNPHAIHMYICLIHTPCIRTHMDEAQYICMSLNI